MNDLNPNNNDRKIIALNLFQNNQLSESLELCREICEHDDPVDVGVWMLQAAIHAKSGSLDEVIRCCNNAIGLQPENIQARYNLGIALQATQQPYAAIDQYTKILHLAPDHHSALTNQGAAYFELGVTDKAEDCLTRALQVAPNFIPAMNCLGRVLLAQSRLKDAAVFFNRVRHVQPLNVEANIGIGSILSERGDFEMAVMHFERFAISVPDNPETYFNLGTCYKALHLSDRAEAAFRNAIRYCPNYTAAYNNLGNLLRATGKIEEAIECLQQAVALSPVNARIHHNLSVSLYHSGKIDQAIHHAIRSVELASDDLAIKQNLVRILSHTEKPSKYISRSQLIELFSDNCIDLQILARPALSVLSTDLCLPQLMEVLSIRDISQPEEIISDSMNKAVFKDSLFHAILQHTCISNMQIECYLSKLRHVFLSYSIIISKNITQVYLAEYVDFTASLACQCFNNEYCYSLTADESDNANQLANILCGMNNPHPVAQEMIEFLVSVLGCYFPLFKLSRLIEILLPNRNRLRPAVQLLLQRQIHEPEEENIIKQLIPQITDISDEVSMAVRQQYEESPYPRWISFPKQHSRDYKDYFRELFPDFIPPDFGTGKLNVLIAGCGSGRHALITATRFTQSSILAVDLSRSSLAYGSRKAAEYKIFNTEFAQGDILGFSNIERRFHIIESVGVLHHMNEPEAGLDVLVNLLEPAGLINIGLYSKIGRRHITQARNFCHAKGFKPDTEGIRLSRQMIYTQASGHPIKDVLNMHDFFSLSECRDLIFHAQETCYDLSEIMNMLDKADLQFIGFESANPTIKSKFQNRYPGNSSMTDIRLWRQFEQENPDTFKEMYVFWCQKLPHKPTFNQKLVK